MQYLELINNFWRIDEQKGFNGNTTRLYFFLLYIANRSYWELDWLEYGDKKMRTILDISAEVLRTAREKLQEASLIKFVSGGEEQGIKTRYQILTPKVKPIPDPNLENHYIIRLILKLIIAIQMENIRKENSLPEGVTLISQFDICESILQNRFFDEKKKNEPIIEQLYLYLLMDDRFDGDLQKGIMLMGKYGCGKTIIMEAFVEMYNTIVSELFIQKPLLTFIRSINLLENIKLNTVLPYSKRPLVIDEFGREPKQIMDFGNLRSPVIELLCERHDAGIWTHGTTNFTFESLFSENQYGRMTGDRIKSMFNFIELKGNSRRK